MKNIWLDVTTIYGWRRPVVGIVRTELECVKDALLRLNVKGKKIRFCIYIQGAGYKEINRDEIQKIVFFLDNVKREERPNLDKKKSYLSLEDRLKLTFFSCIKIIPPYFRGQLINYFKVKKPAIDHAISGLRNFKIFCSLWKNLKVKNQIFIESDVKDISLYSDPFGVDDSYISMGLDWDNKDFSFLYKLKKEKKLNVVLFCYDIIPVKYPHLCVSDVAGKFAHYFSDVAWCADKILCISECTKHDIFNLLSEIGAPVPTLEVIKLGGDIGNANGSDVSLSNEVASLVTRKYILFVSTIERRKNHEVLYRAYTKLIDKGIIDLPVLVFVGMPGWGVQDLLSDIQLDPRVKGKIEILNNVTDDELATLYKNAYFTVYPSLYEGWGLPIAESLAYGKYCLASNSASIPEVGGSLLEYLEPWSPVEWASRIEFYISNSDAILDHERNIKENYKIQKWSSTASKVFESI